MNKTTEQKALKFIDENNLITRGDKVLVAFSGGADSVFLLHFLIKYKRRLGIEIAAFHLNHKLRGKSAEKDKRFCAEFCKKNDIKFYSVTKDVKAVAKKKKISLEEAGREIRYNELDKAVKKFKAKSIATAHNSSDNIETILLNLVKGTGIKGLMGIPVRRENIIRPILCLSADEIRDYLKKIKVDYRFDKSNLDTDYERNFLRNEIIPKLKKRLNTRLEEKIGNTSKVLKEINSFMKAEINKLEKNAVEFNGKILKISLKKISRADKSLQSIFLKSTIEKKFYIELSSENINSLIELIGSQSGKSIQLKEKVFAEREREHILIHRRSIKRNRTKGYKIKVGEKAELDGIIISIEQINKKNIKFTSDKLVEYISGDATGNEFEIRKWKSGDTFRPISFSGTKKISDFLTDEKIPSSEKKEKLVLTNSGMIVWVIGLRIDDRFKVTPDTKKILKLTVKEK
jgi:tRNA(Ile)-lysidine synthase